MANEGTMSTLTAQQAEALLSSVGNVAVADIRVAATTNDVFRVATAHHGTYFIKFHTARWYADQPDTFFVVQRECAVPELLRKRGIPLPYRAWGAFERTVVPRSVFICEELGGIPLPTALEQFPEEAESILRSFGRYMRMLHSIAFSRPGLVEPAHVYFAPPAGTIPPVPAWQGGGLHSAAVFQSEALGLLEQKASLLPDDVVPRLSNMFLSLGDLIRADYDPPRFTVGNCHAWHFHMEKSNGAWEVLGFYDFEACSAGDANIDLVELDITLTPATRGTAWRHPFFEGYASRPSFEGYKRRLLYYLLCEVGRKHARMIPDTAWLEGQWHGLMDAGNWEAFTWCPETR
jgi:hypothetical protein